MFCGWRVLVALFAVFAAPVLKARFGTARSLYGNFALLAADLAVIGIWSGRPTVVIVAVIVAGAFLGVNNTLVTTAVMSIAPVERPVASATYGFARFIGGGLAPHAAAKLVEHTNAHVPFLTDSGRARHRRLGAICPMASIERHSRTSANDLSTQPDATKQGIDDEVEGHPRLTAAGSRPRRRARTINIAGRAARLPQDLRHAFSRLSSRPGPTATWLRRLCDLDACGCSEGNCPVNDAAIALQRESRASSADP